MPTTPTERESCIAQFRKMKAEGIDLNRYERTFLAVADERDEAVRLLERWARSSVTPSSELDVTMRAFLARIKGRP